MNAYSCDAFAVVMLDAMEKSTAQVYLLWTFLLNLFKNLFSCSQVLIELQYIKRSWFGKSINSEFNFYFTVDYFETLNSLL